MCPATRLPRVGLLLWATLLSLAFLSTGARADAATPPVVVAHLDGMIDPVTARYLHRAVASATELRATVLVITIDTPGGLDTSMRQMVQDLLNAPVPTVVFVWPPGARDASAGVFITQAANVVAMAPGTNIGAAHPVGSGGETIQGDLRDKVTNDAAAYLAGIAKQRGRNDVWVQDAVRKSASLDAQAAVDARVADLIAPDLPALLRAIDGRTVVTSTGTATIRTAGAPVTTLAMQPVERIVQKLADPTIAYLLLTIGVYALLIEFFHPGALVPGVAGAVCLILAVVAFAALPLNWGGVLLILVAAVLFVLDIKAAAHGALTVAGLVSFVLGSLLLYNPPGPRSPALPQVAVALPVIVAMAAVSGLFSLLIVGAAVRVARRPALTATESLPGALGTTSSVLDPAGTVRVGGQLWSARLRGGTLAPGQPVRVLARKGLTLEVEAVDTGNQKEQEGMLWPPV